MREFCGAILLEEPPTVEYKSGLFYIIDAEGIVRAMRPNVFFRTFQHCATAIQDYHATEGAEIIPISPAAHG